MADNVTYYGISIFTSRTFWFNTLTLIVSALSATDVLTVIPPKYLPMLTAFVAIANIYLRTITVRPAVLTVPGKTVPVAVARIGPPPPAGLTD